MNVSDKPPPTTTLHGFVTDFGSASNAITTKACMNYDVSIDCRSMKKSATFIPQFSPNRQPKKTAAEATV
jgi:hypothetical protein